jgi:FtsP/CotA-like multicopper oxidase with cupredoxin domain
VTKQQIGVRILATLLLPFLLGWSESAWAQSKPAKQVRGRTEAAPMESPMPMRRMTNAQRRAAATAAGARRAVALAHEQERSMTSAAPPATENGRFKAATMMMTMAAPAAPQANADYFGVANYANSPSPAGDLVAINIIDGGSGYSNPTVIIVDPVCAVQPGVSTTATVQNGTIASIAIPGPALTGCIAPQVFIADTAPGTGSGAMASAAIGGTLTGGIPKFVDALAGLPIAVPDTVSFPGSDYYEISLTQYSQKLHSSLAATTLRGYVQINQGTDASGNNTIAPPAQQYLGPVILAERGRPVRVTFRNNLPTGAGGNLFIPVDTTFMGAGNGPDGTPYLQNRATLHLHGGNTPWISDGTPHQWTVPAGEWSGTSYPRGDSTQFVPDMFFDASGKLVPVPQCTATQTTNCWPTALPAGLANDPGPGSMTFYYTNQQSGRLMFYHDHAYGITRLNVYSGEAAGYLLVDPAQEDLLAAATVPGTLGRVPDLAHMVPLVIQDKTFVPSAPQLNAEDPTWAWGNAPLASASNGDLWFPHVYTPNQNPTDLSGANPFGRWDYGPWFFPPQTQLTAANPPTAVTIPCSSAAYPGQTLQCPITPNPSGTPEAFMDTPVVNGTAYPVMHVEAAPYRFQILSAGNDRTLNLSLFLADTSVPCPANVAPGCEVKMVPAVKTAGFPSTWPTDGRDGGVPDFLAAGPPFVQIGSEGGLLPSPAIIPPTPVGYEYNRRSITVLNISTHALMLGPAERADVIVDFSSYAGKTLILYNDAPTPVPAFDERTDYYTGSPDQVSMGGAPPTQPGYGPNTRTIMQIIVGNPSATSNSFNLASLQTALPSVFKQVAYVDSTLLSTPAIVPQPTYPVASGGNSPTATYARISDNTITYTPLGATAPVTVAYEQKAIQELFTLDYGRMNATLGVEMPLTNYRTQTTIPYGYVEWPTEILQDGKPQFWKITHNGVDTHFIHFHLFNVQVINRIGWDGAVKAPDANELGWKDTVRMNPLEDIVVALQPFRQQLPWPVRDSIRLADVTMPAGMTDPMMSGIDPNNQAVSTVNQILNFGQEYVWHCHILGHEENDMMRPMVFQVAPPAPANLQASPLTGQVQLGFTDMSASESAFTLERSLNDPTFATPTQISLAPSLPAAGTSVPGTSFGATMPYTDTVPAPDPVNGSVYYYRVRAEDNFQPTNPSSYASWVAQPMSSPWSNVATLASTSMTISAPAITYGQDGIVTVTMAAPQGVVVTGNVTLTVDAGAPITQALSAGVAVFTLTTPTAGNHALAAAYLAQPGFFGSSATGTLVVNTLAASVTPNATSKVYGAVDPAFSGVLTGFLPADNVTATYARTTGETVAGSPYTISATLAPATVLSNYAITYNTASFTITPAALTITANSATRLFGAPNPAFTATYAGFLNGDTPAVLTGALACVSTATATSPAGTYPINCSGQSATNYAITYAPGTLTITQAPLMITANNATRALGTPNPVFTATYSGFVNGDTPAALAGTLACATTATATSPAGAYPITCSGQSSTNYAITYVPGTLTVTQAPLTITANSASRAVGAPNPAFTATYAGFVNGDTPAVLTGTLLCVTTATATSPAGIYPITCSGQSSTNYAITYVPGTLTVTAVPAPVLSLSPAALTFSSPPLVTSAAQTVTVSNVGTAPLIINSITRTGANAARFGSTNVNCPIGGTGLAAGASCTVHVTFTPNNTPVARTASLNVNVRAPAISGSVSLTGNTVQSAVSVSPTSIAFGNQPINTTSASHAITVTNTGTLPVVISSVALGGANPGSFVLGNGCPIGGAGLAVGNSCTINVSFRPNRRTARSASVAVRDNAVGSPQTVALTGTGI